MIQSIVLQAFLTDGANVLERLARMYLFIILIDNFYTGDTFIKVNADLTDLRDACFFVKVSHWKHVFMVDLRNITLVSSRH